METHVRQRIRDQGPSGQKLNILLQESPEISYKKALSRLIYIAAVACIFLWVLQSNFVLVGSHSHGHAHDHDDHYHEDDGPVNAAYKYSKEANEKLVSRLQY